MPVESKERRDCRLDDMPPAEKLTCWALLGVEIKVAP